MTRPWLLRACAALLFTSLAGAATGQVRATEAARLRREAAAVTIVRDDWGVSHVHGADRRARRVRA